MKQSGPGKIKVAPPRISKVVARKRLFKQLDAMPTPGALWVRGPPGIGKTTLVASYLEHADGTKLWYPLDADDADPGTFFREFSLALRAVAPQAQRALPRYTSEPRRDLIPHARRFFRALFAALPQPCTLVLDNVQQLPSDSPLHTLIATAIEELPSETRVVLISRTAAPAYYAPLRAARLLHALEEDTLPLTSAEAEQLARLLLGRPLAPSVAEQLHALSQGWAAGIILLLESMRTGTFTRNERIALRVESTFDYFATVLFERLDEKSQEFLLKCSLLPTISSAAAQTLCGSEQAAQLLQELHRNNYFTVLHARPGVAYQFHALFRHFLQARAAATFPPHEWRVLQQQAAELLEHESQFHDALKLYSAATDWAEAIRLILTHASGLVEQGRLQTLSEWLDQLPALLVQAEPCLIYWRGICLLFAQPSAVRALFEQARAAFEERGHYLGRTLACAGLIDSMLFEMGASNRLDPSIAALEEALRNTPAFPSCDVEARVLNSFFSALMIRRPQHPDIRAVAERLLQAAGGVEDVNLRVLAEQNVAYFYIFCGEMNRAFACIEASRRTVRARKPGPMAVITLRAVEVWFAMLTGQHAHCLRQFKKAMALAGETGIHIWSPQLLGNALASAIAEGDSRAAKRIGKEYAALPLEGHPIDIAYQQCILAWQRLAEGDDTAALRYQSAALDLAERVGMLFLQALSQLGMAHVQHARGNAEGGEPHLISAQDIAVQAGIDVLRFPCLLAAAHFAFARGEVAGGPGYLRTALRLGRTHGYLSAYWWRPDWMADLAERALRAEVEVPYVQDLIRRRDLRPKEPPLDCSAWPWRVKIFTLGRFELVIDDCPLRFQGKAKEKSLELLKALIAYDKPEVPVQWLLDTLWPDADTKAAFTMALKRLRELLCVPHLIQLSNRRVALDACRCWVDTWDYKRHHRRVEAAIKMRDRDGAWRALEAALALYEGEFLPGDDAAWGIELRDRLRRCLHYDIQAVGELLLAENEDQHALYCYQRGLELDPLAETFQLGLRRCSQRFGRHGNA